jgi:hypothetical protein
MGVRAERTQRGLPGPSGGEQDHARCRAGGRRLPGWVLRLQLCPPVRVRLRGGRPHPTAKELLLPALRYRERGRFTETPEDPDAETLIYRDSREVEWPLGYPRHPIPTT